MGNPRYYKETLMIVKTVGKTVILVAAEGVGSAFNLLFKTSVGAVEGDKSVAYLRGETAQVIFAEFACLAHS